MLKFQPQLSYGMSEMEAAASTPGIARTFSSAGSRKRSTVLPAGEAVGEIVVWSVKIGSGSKPGSLPINDAKPLITSPAPSSSTSDSDTSAQTHDRNPRRSARL